MRLIQAGDAASAAPLLQRAAEAGFVLAQYRLATLYESGRGVPADLTLARTWTERAAAGGNLRAMHDLGVYFANGEGVEHDDEAAFRWFRQAAEFGLADSQFNLGVLYLNGRGVAQDRQEALFWFLLAGAQGDEAAASHALDLEVLLSPNEAQQARERALAFRARAANAAANATDAF